VQIDPETLLLESLRSTSRPSEATNSLSATQVNQIGDSPGLTGCRRSAPHRRITVTSVRPSLG
jgi:hypothetical protein